MTCSQQRGFSLIELMVVTSIISILAAVGLPKMKEFKARAAQAEVKGMMRQIYIGQQSYFAENGRFSYLYSFGGEWGECNNNTKFQMANLIGLQTNQKSCAQLRYTYTTNASSADKFHASAMNRKLFPNCLNSDVWTMTTDMDLRNVSNAIENCR